MNAENFINGFDYVDIIKRVCKIGNIYDNPELLEVE